MKRGTLDVVTKWVSIAQGNPTASPRSYAQEILTAMAGLEEEEGEEEEQVPVSITEGYTAPSIEHECPEGGDVHDIITVRKGLTHNEVRCVRCQETFEDPVS